MKVWIRIAKWVGFDKCQHAVLNGVGKKRYILIFILLIETEFKLFSHTIVYQLECLFCELFAHVFCSGVLLTLKYLVFH